MPTCISEKKLPRRRPRVFRYSLRGLRLLFTLLPIGMWYWWQRPFEVEVVIDNGEYPSRYYRREVRTVRRSGWDDLVRHGPTFVFDKSGRMIREELWRDELLHGPYKRWGSNGEMVNRGQ